MRSPPLDARSARCDAPASARSPLGELDVEGDQERPRADRDRAGRDVRRVAEVEAPARVARRARSAKPFELAAPHVGQVLAVRRARGRAVEVRRDAELAPDAGGGAVRERDRVVERRRAERDERQHVERADARVRAAVRAQVDALVRDARQRDRRRDGLRARCRPR